VTYRLLALAQQLDQATMRQVFTHTSWAPDRVSSYERLEFLGDSVLSLCVTTELYRRFPDFAEGHLARLRAYIVSRATCARVATKLGLGKMLRQHAGQGAEAGDAAQLHSNQNVLADLTESLIGAVYLTFGYEAVRPAVIEVFDEHIVYAESSYIDHKTELQEYLARSGQSVAYKVQGFSGPPHNREFEIEAVVDGESLGRGFGTSKKRAEQEAAAEALHELQARARRTARRARLRGSRARKTQDEAEAGQEPAAAGGSEAPDAGAGVDVTDEVGAARTGSPGATEVG
jgi:ribonuclease-3